MAAKKTTKKAAPDRKSTKKVTKRVAKAAKPALPVALASAAKTTKKATETVPEPKPAKPDVVASWRVIPVSDVLRDKLKEKRDLTPVPGTLRTVVAEAVATHLAPLVTALEDLELDSERSTETNPVRPLRMKVDYATLQTLRYAANQLGIPAQRLLLACMKLAMKD